MEQIREARDNHAEMIALRTLILEYTRLSAKTYPKNTELQETMSALSTVVLLRPIPTDRATYMNEKYYSRFARRNATAKQRQAAIRAGMYTGEPRKYRKRASPQGEAPTYGRRVNPIMPRIDPDDKELEFEIIENVGGFTLDIPPDPYENG